MKRDMKAHRGVVAELHELYVYVYAPKKWKQMASLVVCHCTTAK
jgi:hypothetical protein